MDGDKADRSSPLNSHGDSFDPCPDGMFLVVMIACTRIKGKNTSGIPILNR